MELMVVVILAFVLFWGSIFLSDFILKHIKRPKIIGLLFILLAVLIGFEFYDKTSWWPAHPFSSGLSAPGYC